MNILIINCGSSSFKFQLINMEDEKKIAGGTVLSYEAWSAGACDSNQ